LFPYWILFSVFTAGAVQHRPDPRRLVQGGPILLAASLFAVLMIGFRYEVGGDWENYVNILHEITDGNLSQFRLVEPGYWLLNLLVGKMGLGIWAVNLVCAALFIWGMMRFARRQPNPWLVMVIAIPYLIIVVGMGYTRQAVAIGFICAGLADLERASLARFVVYMILASAFHKSAMVVVPIVALSAARNRLVTGLVLLLSMGLLYYLFVEAAVDQLVASYVESEYQSQGAAVRVAMNLPPAILFILLQKRFQLSEQRTKLWRNFSYAALLALVALLTTHASAAVDRLALYLIPLQMFVLGRLPGVFAERGRFNSQIMLAVLIYSAAIQFVWLNYADNSEFWVPYKVGASNHDEGSED
jgi:hypothetical protein